jgi:hypothetical protein
LRRRAVLLAGLLVGLLVAGGCGGDPSAASPPPPEDEDDGRRIGSLPANRFYIQHDLFLAADRPATVPAREADFLRDDDEVFGIVIRDRPRAYPITMLSYHHVVNDVIEGVPVAVTY